MYSLLAQLDKPVWDEGVIVSGTGQECYTLLPESHLEMQRFEKDGQKDALRQAFLE